MSEPRYDFCLAVIRRHESIGHVLNQIVPVYCSSIPQDDRARRDWCGNSAIRLNLAHRISELKPIPKRERIFDRDEDYGFGNLVLWGLVPVLGSYQCAVEKVLLEFPDLGSFPFPLSNEFIVMTLGMSVWFEEVCNRLNDMKGGRYLIRNPQKSEVPRYAL